MPNLCDLLFGSDHEMGITNPAFNEFLQGNLWRLGGQINKYINEQQAVKLRVQVRIFNEKIVKEALTKKDCFQALRELLKDYYYEKELDLLEQKFSESMFEELKKLAPITMIYNRKLRLYLLDFARWCDRQQIQGEIRSTIAFAPTVQQVATFNQLYAAVNPRLLDSVLQEAFGKELNKVIFGNDSRQEIKQEPFELTLVNILLSQEETIRTKSIVDICREIFEYRIPLNDITDLLLGGEILRHAIANPLFKQINTFPLKSLLEINRLIPYDPNIERYVEMVDQALQQGGNGVYAQDKFTGQGIPKQFFSKDGVASASKEFLHRLAPLNLIHEPILRRILVEYGIANLEFKPTIEEVNYLNLRLAEIDFEDSKTVGKVLDNIIQGTWVNTPNEKKPAPGYIQSYNTRQIELLRLEHQRVKPLYQIPDDFLRAQFLIFAFNETGRDFHPTDHQVKKFMLSIGDLIAKKAALLSIDELETLANTIWSKISWWPIIGDSIKFFEKHVRTQALYLIARPQLRAALFEYYHYSLSFIGLTVNQVQTLNKAITMRASIELKDAQVFDKLLHDSEIFVRRNMSASNIAEPADRAIKVFTGHIAEKVVAEAERLRPLYRIYFLPIREMLIRWAILHPNFVWQKNKVDALNSALCQSDFYEKFRASYNICERAVNEKQPREKLLELHNLAANCFIKVINSIWSDIPNSFIELATSAGMSKQQRETFIVKEFLQILPAIGWFNKLLKGATDLEEWFATHQLFRDAAIDNLKSFLKKHLNFEKQIFVEVRERVKAVKTASDYNNLLAILTTKIININTQKLLISEDKQERYDQISRNALQDLLGLGRQHEYYHLLECNESSKVKQTLVEYWCKYEPKVPPLTYFIPLLRDLEPILKMEDRDAIVAHLGKIFIANEAHDHLEKFKHALITDLVHGGGGLNTVPGVRRLQGQIRLLQLKELGLTHFVKSLLLSENNFEHRDKALQELAAFTHGKWIRWLIDLIEDKTDDLIQAGRKITSANEQIEEFKQRFIPLLNIERSALREALFDYAFSPAGQKFSPQCVEVWSLNKLIQDNALLSLDSSQALNNILRKVWSQLPTNLFEKDGVLASRAQDVLAEAYRLRYLSLITLLPLRKYLTSIALALPTFHEWSEVNINKLNTQILQAFHMGILKCDKLINLIYNDIWPNLNNHIKSIRDKDANNTGDLHNTISWLNQLYTGIILLDDLLLPLDNLRKWFMLHVFERDEVIQKLAQIDEYGEKFKVEFLESFWKEINKISGNSQLDLEEQSQAVLKLFEAKMGISTLLKLGAKIDTPKEISELALNELVIAARYWGSVSMLKERLNNFPFLYQPQIANFLIQHGQEQGFFDPIEVSKELEKISKVEDVNLICDLVVEQFAPNSKEFSELLITIDESDKDRLEKYDNLLIAKGQIRLSQFKIALFMKWINDSFPELDRIRVLKQLGVFNGIEWQNWQNTMIDLLVFAKTSTQLLEVICGQADYCLIEQFTDALPVLSEDLANKIIEEARTVKSLQAMVRGSASLVTSPAKQHNQKQLPCGDSSYEQPKQPAAFVLEELERKLKLAQRLSATVPGIQSVVKADINNTDANTPPESGRNPSPQ